VQPFTPVVSSERPTFSRRYALFASGGGALLVLTALAVLATQVRQTHDELMQGSDEVQCMSDSAPSHPSDTQPRMPSNRLMMLKEKV